MKGDRLSGAVQESLLAILCFDPTEAPVIRALVPTKLYDPYFREIAEEAELYLDRYKQPAGDHLYDIIEGLKERKAEKAEQFSKLYSSILRTKDLINKYYVLNQARSFIRRQTMRAVIQKVGPIVLRNNVTDVQLDEAEALLLNLGKQTLELDSPGLLLNDPLQALSFLEEEDNEILPLGIPELDVVEAGPARGKQWLFLAATGRGKSQCAVHLVRQGILYGWNVLYVTLEMSEKQVAQRCIQCLTSTSKRDAKQLLHHFRKDELGRFMGFEEVEAIRPHLKQPGIRNQLQKKISPLKNRARVIIKQFPSGQLTIKGLKAYLDRLEATVNFLPDCMVLDYADIMDVDPKHKRESIGKIHVDLRGIAVERNLASVTFSQTNRAGMLAKKVGLTSTGEDISKTHNADTVITYGQTDAEREMGYARLFLAKNRNDFTGFQVLISQAYALCQFVVDSARMVDSTYWSQVENRDDEDDEDEEKPQEQKRLSHAKAAAH